jgi:pilus assembly protein CpaE
MIHCALISADESLQRQVTGLVRASGGTAKLVVELTECASDLPKGHVSHVLDASPQLVFVDLGDSSAGLRVIELLSQEAPETAIIAAGPSVSADDLLRVIRAGATEYLPRPFSAGEVSDAFQRVRRRLGTIAPDEGTGRGKVTTVFSPKGGAGVTMLAVNLSVALQQLTEKSTLLVDFTPSLGTAALTMGLQPRYSYLDVIQNFHRIDQELFKSFLEVHESGVHVLASPPRSEDQNGPSADSVMGVLRLCRRHFGHTVVDAGHSLTNAVDTALMEADRRIVVTTPELPTLRNVKRALEVFGDHGTNGKSKPYLVLNQYWEGVGLSPEDVEGALGLSVATVIERDDSLPENINLGSPALLNGRSRYARSIIGIGRDIAGPEQLLPIRDGFLKTLLKPFRPSQPVTATEEHS